MKEDQESKLVLSWRCIDDFNKAYPDNVCWTGSLDISKRQAVILREIFASMKEKWTREIKDAFFEDEEALEIAGGNYTFFFVLPSVFRHFRERHPFLNVKLRLLELSDDYDLGSCGADIILSSFYEKTDVHKFTASIFEKGYVFQRRTFVDHAFLASSKESAVGYGSKEEVLKEHDIVVDRVFETYTSRGKREKRLQYKNAPEGRQKEMPRLTIDFYYMGYNFMLHDLGISHVFSSDKNISNVLVLQDKPVAKMQRFLLLKKDLRSSYKRSISNSLKGFFYDNGI